MRYGTHSAGIGLRKNKGESAFEEKLRAVCDKAKIKLPSIWSDTAEILVGAEVCNVKLGSTSAEAFKFFMERVRKVKTIPPLVRMKSSFLWAAIYRERSLEDPHTPAPERGLSWREFRILCALLSVQVNARGYSFIGWESIQARSCGHASKAAHNQDSEIRKDLQPLTRKQIRITLDTLEELNFFARFHFSSGRSGGLTAYSFRLTREALGELVCRDANFRDRMKTAGNRQEDAATCARLLGRASPKKRGHPTTNIGPGPEQG